MAEEEKINTQITLAGSAKDTESPLADGTALAEDLLSKCQILLTELEAFGTFIAEQKLEQDSAADTRKFQNSVVTELKSLQKVQE